MAEAIWARAVAKVKRRWGEYTFNRVGEGVLNTAPLPIRDGSPIFLSQLCHRDVAAYLLAIKSLYLAVGQGHVAIVNDGSLTAEDLSILRHHIPGIEVLGIETIDTGTCPRGGTWERLVKIIELTADRYVIQADADILVSGSIPEVVRCWEENKSFLLGTRSGQRVAPAPELARLAQSWIKAGTSPRPTVGMLAEAALDSLPQAEARNYVHASSGFAGFAKAAFRLEDLEEFSGLMRERLAHRWNEVGSEQIASNYMLANAPNAEVLPLSRYACFEPHLPPGGRSFLHFIGTYRFRDGEYRRRAATFLDDYVTGSTNAVRQSATQQSRR